MENSTQAENGDISFMAPDKSKMLELKANGEIFLKGKLIGDDKDIITGFKSWLATCWKSTLDRVKEFHGKFEHPVAKLEDLEPLNIRQLRIKLLFEEIEELSVAGDVRATFAHLCNNHMEKWVLSPVPDGDNVDKVEELDALSDIQYVLDGKYLTSGLHELKEKGFELVHQNNMTKAHRDEAHIAETASKIGVQLNAIEKDGTWRAFNPDGKLVKPWDHIKVSFKTIFPVKEESGS